VRQTSLYFDEKDSEKEILNSKKSRGDNPQGGFRTARALGEEMDGEGRAEDSFLEGRKKKPTGGGVEKKKRNFRIWPSSAPARAQKGRGSLRRTFRGELGEGGLRYRWGAGPIVSHSRSKRRGGRGKASSRLR